MHLIKLNAINSTNSYGREMFKENPLLPPTCIVTRQQLQGRGQRGTNWSSKPGQNLTFSMVFPKPGVSLSHQFLLSAVVSTAIVKQLERLHVPKLKVKWPNDIMAANLKIAGILIENVIADGNLAASIIGVGLNVNQTEFDGLPAAGSLKLASGQNFNLEEVLNGILASVETEMNTIKDAHSDKILKEYKKHLFRFKVPSTFQLPDQTLFTGIIEDVSLNGKLLVKTEDDLLKEFDLKEIKFCF